MAFVFKVGNFFFSHKILSHHAKSLKSRLLLTVSRVKAFLQRVRRWETFYQSGKLLSDFQKVSHPQIPCGCKAQSHKWESGKLFLSIFFARRKDVICYKKKVEKKFPTFPLMAQNPWRCKAERVGNFFQNCYKVSHFSMILSHFAIKFPTLA